MSEARANTLTKELAALDKTMADLRKKEGELSRRQAQVSVAIASAKTRSTLSTKTRELERVLKDLANVHDKLSSTLKRRVGKESELTRVRAAIQGKREKELKRIATFEEKQRKEQLQKEHAFQRQISEMRAANPTAQVAPAEVEKQHDFFISHASEDKQDVARPLYEALTDLGCSVWYDEFSLKVGDSLRRNIEKGIVGSRYGVVIVSEPFLAKEWPARELDAITAIEIAGEKKILLPIWHRVTKDFVLLKAPMLADKLALNTATKTIPEIALELKGLLE
jgi:hypothetical protein